MMSHDHQGHSHGIGGASARAESRAAGLDVCANAVVHAGRDRGRLRVRLIGAIGRRRAHVLGRGGAGLELVCRLDQRAPPTPTHSYGYYRAEILAALANGATLVAIAILIVIEAIHRLSDPQPVEGLLMLGIAAGGLVINILGLAILNAGKSENLNMHGAWLHLLTDALGSVAALLAGGLIWLAGWYWVDPVASILIALLVTYSSWNLLKQAIAILMESTPSHLNVDEVRSAMAQTPGACDVHDLHIWTITSGMVSLSAHIVLSEGQDSAAALDLGAHRIARPLRHRPHHHPDRAKRPARLSDVVLS